VIKHSNLVVDIIFIVMIVSKKEKDYAQLNQEKMLGKIKKLTPK